MLWFRGRSHSIISLVVNGFEKQNSDTSSDNEKGYQLQSCRCGGDESPHRHKERACWRVGRPRQDPGGRMTRFGRNEREVARRKGAAYMLSIHMPKLLLNTSRHSSRQRRETGRNVFGGTVSLPITPLAGLGLVVDSNGGCAEKKKSYRGLSMGATPHHHPTLTKVRQ